MIFKDRLDAAEKLLEALEKDALIKRRRNLVVISLLKGGVILGDVLSKKLKAVHLPLPVVKISAPQNEELAIGALVFDVVYLEKKVIDSLLLLKPMIREQISQAKEKFKDYSQRFPIKEGDYKNLKGKTVILVDDGIATGATMKAAVLFVRERGASKVMVSSPVSAEDFNIPGVDKAIILQTDPYFTAVSKFYAQFPQITESEVKTLLKKR